MPALNLIRRRYHHLTDEEAAEKHAEDKAWSARYNVAHKGQCLKCLHEGDVKWWHSMTQYEYTAAQKAAGEPDPNADLELCEVCGPEHIQEMTDQWDEYHRGLL